MTDPKQVKKVWEEKGKDLIQPRIFLAYDKNMQDYFVYEDSSTIVRLYLNKSNISFVIPKKYCKLMGDRYMIIDSFKLTPIQCPKKNKYQLFIAENLVF